MHFFYEKSNKKKSFHFFLSFRLSNSWEKLSQQLGKFKNKIGSEILTILEKSEMFIFS